MNLNYPDFLSGTKGPLGAKPYLPPRVEHDSGVAAAAAVDPAAATATTAVGTTVVGTTATTTAKDRGEEIEETRTAAEVAAGLAADVFKVGEASASASGSSDGRRQFDEMLFSKLAKLDGRKQDGEVVTGSPLVASGHFFDGSSGFELPQNAAQDSFNLPVELQGGIGTISLRRPSYAAESFTRSTMPEGVPFQLPMSHGLESSGSTTTSSLEKSLINSSGSGSGSGSGGATATANVGANAGANASAEKQSLSAFAAANNFSANHGFDLGPFSSSFSQMSLNSVYSDFQSRRPSQLVDIQSHGPAFNQFPPRVNFAAAAQQQQNLPNSFVKLENGLLLKDQYIIASANLKSLYLKTTKYFHNPQTSDQIVSELKQLLTNPAIMKLITFIKNLNNLTFNHKILCLVVNKNGKFDLLSYPNNSNICLQKNDLVIVDGDRGKDMVMILEPLVDLNFATLFNFLKKLEHLKSLTILDTSQNSSNPTHGKSKRTSGGTHATSLSASVIVNTQTNEDNEFIITFPTKQVLRFATSKEVHKLSGKFLEEKKAFITCFNKIKELNLDHDLELINVEYQADFKKLIFYYFAGFRRIDFRCLIKELFKIYKTRIWLCAVLPYDRPELYITPDDEYSTAGSSGVAESKLAPGKKQRPPRAGGNVSELIANTSHIPGEYDLSNDQILNFSIEEIEKLTVPSYFHLKNMMNLIRSLSNDIKGNFYGFNNKGASDYSEVPPPNYVNSGSLTSPSQLGGASANSGAHAAPLNGSIFVQQEPSLGFQGRSSIFPKFNPFGDDKPSFQHNI